MTNLPVPATPNSPALHFGQTSLSSDQLVLPRVKVIQAQSAEVGTLGAKPGDFFNTLTLQNYGPRLRFVPISPFMNRLLLVREERRERIDGALALAGLPVLPADANGLTCRSIDMLVGRGDPGIECDACPLSKWVGNDAPLCSESYNVAGMDEYGDLLILSFSKSSAKAGKRLFSMLRLTRQAPWTSWYEATTHQEQLKGKGTFQVPDVTKLAGETPPPELIKWGAEWATQFGQVGPIDVTPDTDDAAESEGGDNPF